MQGNLPPEAQEKLEELQDLQETAQQVAAQKQQADTQLNESKTALEQLENIDEDTTMYRNVGELLVETEYDEAQEDLEEKVESLEVRVETLEKQEERVQNQFEQLQGELQQMLSGAGGGGWPGRHRWSGSRRGMNNGGETTPSDTEVVRAASDAAEKMVFSRLDRSDVEDLDVTVLYEDQILQLDIYLHAPAAKVNTQKVAEDAVLAGREAADELLS